EPAVVGGGAAGAGRQGEGAERVAVGRVERPHLAAGGEGVELAVAAEVEVDRVEPGGEPSGGVVGEVEPDDAAVAGGVGPGLHVGGEDVVLVAGDAAVAVEVDG